MTIKKIAIIHFQPLEKYPPVMNIINDIAAMSNVSCSIYSTNNKSKNWFNVNGVNIFRFATIYQNSLLRYWCYFKFNCSCLLFLLLKRPQTIIAFEAYSILPLYIYSNFFKHIISIIHYHEYISQQEISKGSAYTKFLNKLEIKLYKTCHYISQTNVERQTLFLNDYKFIDVRKMLINPNFPPKNWYEFAQINKKKNNTGVIKLVHVGAISLSTMYTKEIVNWVIAQNGKYVIDFYTDNITTNATLFFKNINNKNVNLLSGINYFSLPQTLIHYDIGLTLYNGHIPNYIFNVPNKVLEYIACGLQVWYSKDLISTKKFTEINAINGCFEIDFNKNISCSCNENHFFNANMNYYNLMSNSNFFIGLSI